MPGEGALKHFVAAFVIAGACYVLLFFGIEHLRSRKGPWEVTFTSIPSDTGPIPAVIAAQPELGISNVTLAFPTASLPEGFSPHKWVAAEARTVPFEVPFGSVIFLDTTVLPGTVTMRLFGHEIEFIPRTLIIDHTAYRWLNGTNIFLRPSSAGTNSATQAHG